MRLVSKGHSELPLACVFGANEKPQAESANRERRSPDCHLVAAPAAYKPGDDSGQKPCAADQGYVVRHFRFANTVLGLPLAVREGAHLDCRFDDTT